MIYCSTRVNSGQLKKKKSGGSWCSTLQRAEVQFFLIWLISINMTDRGFVVPPESHIIFPYFHGSLLDIGSNCFYSTGLTYLLCLQDHSQSCPTLRDHVDCSLPGSFPHGIFRTRILEQIAIFHSRECVYY